MRQKKIRMIISMLIALTVFALVFCYITMYSTKEKVQAGNSPGTPRKFGATYMTMNNPYFVELNDSIKEVVEGNGDILITRDPAQDQLKQNDQIQEMIEEGVAAIFLQSVDWKKVTPALEACKKAGIPVFNVDSYVYDSNYIVSSILSDNYDAGVQIAKDVMKKMDHAKIIIINHTNINSTSLRVQGFLDVLEGHEEYEIVINKSSTAELEIAMEVMKDILESGVEFDVALGGNDPTALGILAAIQLNHIEKDIRIYGVDGSPDGKLMIERGFLEGTSAQRPIEMGRVAAEAAYSHLRGNKVADNILIPVTLITAENLQQFDITGWQ